MWYDVDAVTFAGACVCARGYRTEPDVNMNQTAGVTNSYRRRSSTGGKVSVLGSLYVQRTLSSQ